MRKAVILIDSIRTNEECDAIISKHMEFLNKTWTTLHINDKELVNSINDYNILLTEPLFWENLPFDKVLIIQHDSGLLRKGIEEFLEWDYVGAPWKFQDYGGNGGLSLRSPDIMAQICRSVPYQRSAGNEDVYLCNAMRLLGIGKLAPRNICAKFSCESILLQGTLGYHAIDKYFNQQECETILNQYK